MSLHVREDNPSKIAQFRKFDTDITENLSYYQSQSQSQNLSESTKIGPKDLVCRRAFLRRPCPYKNKT